MGASSSTTRRGPWSVDVESIPVCQKMEIGMWTPRPTARWVCERGTVRLVQPDTGQDLTKALQRFARVLLDRLPPVDGFLLKNRSHYAPSRTLRSAQRMGCGDSACRLACSSRQRWGGSETCWWKTRGISPTAASRSTSSQLSLPSPRCARSITEGSGTKEIVALHTRHELLPMAYSPRRLEE
jgi:hypothetical protein